MTDRQREAAERWKARAEERRARREQSRIAREAGPKPLAPIELHEDHPMHRAVSSWVSGSRPMAPRAIALPAGAGGLPVPEGMAGFVGSIGYMRKIAAIFGASVRVGIHIPFGLLQGIWKSGDINIWTTTFPPGLLRHLLLQNASKRDLRDVRINFIALLDGGSEYRKALTRIGIQLYFEYTPRHGAKRIYETLIPRLVPHDVMVAHKRGRPATEGEALAFNAASRSPGFGMADIAALFGRSGQIGTSTPTGDGEIASFGQIAAAIRKAGFVPGLAILDPHCGWIQFRRGLRGWVRAYLQELSEEFQPERKDQRVTGIFHPETSLQDVPPCAMLGELHRADIPAALVVSGPDGAIRHATANVDPVLLGDLAALERDLGLRRAPGRNIGEVRLAYPAGSVALHRDTFTLSIDELDPDYELDLAELQDEILRSMDHD